MLRELVITFIYYSETTANFFERVSPKELQAFIPLHDDHRIVWIELNSLLNDLERSCDCPGRRGFFRHCFKEQFVKSMRLPLVNIDKRLESGYGP